MDLDIDIDGNMDMDRDVDKYRTYVDRLSKMWTK
jgi:hypothetical protein